MKTKFTHIKQRDSGAPIRLIVYILLSLVSAACALGPKLLPQLQNLEPNIALIVTIIGIAALAYFLFMTVFTIFRIINPKDAMIICRSGYYDFITEEGNNLFIPWKSIDSAKVFGTKKAPVLGVYLVEPEKLILELDDSTAEELRANIEIGLPPLMYREDEIKEPLQRVLTLFMKRIDSVETINSADPEQSGEFSIPSIKSEQ